VVGQSADNVLRVNVKEMTELYWLLNSSYKYIQAQGARWKGVLPLR
jgi:hypothetical protein